MEDNERKPRMIKLVTHKLTGKKYIYRTKATDAINGELFYCWGEVCIVKGLSTMHEKDKIFAAKNCDITEVPKTQELVIELFEQMVESKREQGFAVRRTRRGNAKIVDHRSKS